MTLYDRIVRLCRNQGIQISNLGETIGIKLDKSTVSHWKKGAVPRAATVKAIADYFGVTPEYLIGDSEAALQTIQGNNNGSIIGHTHAPVTIINGTEHRLTESELALLRIFEELDVVRQAKLLAYAAELAGAQRQ